MNRSFFIILSLVLSFAHFSYSQPYLRLLREDAVWQHSYYSGLYYSSSGFYSVDPDFDTLVDGNHLKRILINSSIIDDNYYYEDSLLGKVFWVDDDFSREMLLYDFSLGLGDSISTFFRFDGPSDSLEPPLHVTTIDTFIIDGKARKVLFLERDYYNFCDREIWIEGIGSSIGLMRESYYDCWHDDVYLTCYSLSSGPLNLLGLLMETYCSVMGLQASKQPIEINLFPNPASTFLHLDFSDIISEFYVYNEMGQLIATYTGNHSLIDIADWAPGLYFLKLNTQKGEVRTKFVKI